MFNQDVSTILMKTGLKKADTAVYLTLLKSPSPLQVYELSKQTGIKRSSVNLILSRLIERGYVTYHLDEARKVYSAENPSKIAFELENITTSLKGILPLLSVSNFGDKPSKVRFFEGEEVVETIYRDIILAMSIKEGRKEISMVVSGEDIWDTDPEITTWFAKKRLENDIYLKMITPESKLVLEKYPPDPKSLREIKFFDPKKYPFHIQVIIYGNCLALVSLKGSRSGVIIENEPLSSSFQSMFNFFWDNSKTT
jgi:HTH-type transcriptional regulator, sugar sensing transcriptional regulator